MLVPALHLRPHQVHHLHTWAKEPKHNQRRSEQNGDDVSMLRRPPSSVCTRSTTCRRCEKGGSNMSVVGAWETSRV
jgi:hypothetical protein